VVSAQVASSLLTDRLPAMCGSETLTMVVSGTSIKAPSVTTLAMIQGLAFGFQPSFGSRGAPRIAPSLIAR